MITELKISQQTKKKAPTTDLIKQKKDSSNLKTGHLKLPSQKNKEIKE